MSNLRADVIDKFPGKVSEQQSILDAREELLTNSGLLLSSGREKAEFYHWTFQDFLAARRLVEKELNHESLLQAIGHRALVPEWRNTLSLVFASLLETNVSPEKAIRLLEQLIDSTQADHFRVHVVIANCIQILLGKEYKLKPEIEKKFRDICLQTLQKRIPAVDRSILGLALGQIGDPRVIPDLRNMRAYIEVLPGKYLQPPGFKGGHLELSKPFLLAKYPVTNGQYAQFIDAGEYKRTGSWSEDGQVWLRRSKVEQPAFWRMSKWNSANQPVIGVTYWEAEAFCNWLGARLPSLVEWEMAAYGVRRRRYPWGEQTDGVMCNTTELGLGVTTSVGIFHESKSLDYDFHDSVGNVRQWTSDFLRLHGSEQSAYVAGLSFADTLQDCESKEQSYFPCDAALPTIGFRPVLTRARPEYDLEFRRQNQGESE